MEEFVGVALSSLGLLTVHQITSREIQETADRNMMKSQTRKPDQRRNGDEALVDEQIDHDVDFITKHFSFMILVPTRQMMVS